MKRGSSPEVKIRRFSDCPDCDVIVISYGRLMVVRLPDYDRAVGWAQMECKAYKIPPAFSEVRD